jgi:ubiquinone/menaquinone biosynthesis C-methylase UbiE
MNENKLKKTVSVIKKKNIYYLTNDKNKLKKFKPWIGDIFSFLYDRIMEKSVFPKKFGGYINKHFELLRKEFKNIHNKNILEIATGSGNAVFFLNNDNQYTGIDISSGLLRQADRRFAKFGFKNVELYNASASELPFDDNNFDMGICNLSLNFFDNIELFIKELSRVLKAEATFFCSVPAPERKTSKSIIHGTLYSENELKTFFQKYSFDFESKPYKNGALLYFIAKLKENEK